MADLREEERRLAGHVGAAAPFPVRCWSCGHSLDADDRYCRQCGQGQGAFLRWYYRPVWIVLLFLVALGPFVLRLVWRTPRLDRTSKWIASVVVVVVSGYLGWLVVIALRELGRLLSGT